MQHLTLTHLLGRKVLIYILLASTVLSLFVTAIQLYNDYRYDLAELEQELLAIEASHLDSLSLNLWDFQDKAIEQQIGGIQRLPFINYVHLSTPQGEVYQAGSAKLATDDSHIFDVVHNQELIGTLRVDADYQVIYNKLWQKAWLILLTQFVKTLLVGFAIVSIVYWLVTRHIYKIEQYASEFNLHKVDDELSLDGERKTKDEIDALVTALNNMRLLVRREFQLRLDSELRLQDFNLHLERKIEQRTQELERSVKQLQETQSSLVQSEKMVALGQLVAGIAHEINTPLGISVTANAVVLDSLRRISELSQQGQLTKQELDEFFQDQLETGLMLQRNLDRAVSLMKSFKSVAVNQSTDSSLECELTQLTQEVLAAVRTMFKAKHYQIDLQAPESLTISTYPSAWTQILTNLLMNSHIHGFEDSRDGNIKIQISRDNDHLVLVYEDDGKGIPEDIIDKVFDPFVTTKRGNGGSGLGLHILFNLVSEKLQGRVQVENLTQGCRFTIRCPL